MATARSGFESILLDRSWVSPQDLAKAHQRKKPGQEIADVLIDMGALEPQRLARALAQEYGLPFQAHIDAATLENDLVAKVPINYAKRNRLLPVASDGATVTVAIADPANYEPLDDLHVLFGKPIVAVVAPAEVINEAINRAYDQAATTTAHDLMIDLEEDRLDQVASELASEPRDLLEADDAAPIIRLVNGLLSQAVKDRASDIHIEVFERDLVVRFRVDGMLFDVLTPQKRFHAAIASRIKVMSGLNIAEKRLPQDGRIRLRIAGRDIDIRVSTIPTAFGERIVLRLLDRAQALVDVNLDRLGFSGDNLPKIERLIHQSHGIILATGPTGSGKTTTLYACLSRINSPEKNIITIEDPIEFVHESKSCLVNHREVGLDTKSFAAALRGALREDPDIIMVGELRDLETIELAMVAASTGHLVLGTLHTPSAAKTVDRIIDVFPADQQNKVRATLSEALKGVVAQNLFKRVDNKGRVAALEILIFTTAIANLVREGKTHQIPGMIQVGKKHGNQPLDDAIMEHLRMKRIFPEEAYDKALDKKKFRPFLSHPPEDEEG